MHKWNGRSSFLDVNCCRTDALRLYTDASGTVGYGAFFNGAWFQDHWPRWLVSRNHSIEYRKLVPIYLAPKIRGIDIRKKRIILQSDNLGFVQAWAAHKSKCPGILELMQRMVATAAEFIFNFTIKHINECNKDIADALSRFRGSRFQTLAPYAAPEPVHIPESFLDIMAAFTDRCRKKCLYPRPPINS